MTGDFVTKNKVSGIALQDIKILMAGLGYLHKGAKAWDIRLRVFFHKSDLYG